MLAYRILCYAIAALVAVQAAAIGYAVFAQLNWLEEGNALDQAAMESGFPGVGAFIFHGINGLVTLLVALALLIVSFFAKVPKGTRWALIVLGIVVLQIALGIFGHWFAVFGGIHGIVALVLAAAASIAGARARRAGSAAVAEPAAAAAV